MRRRFYIPQEVKDSIREHLRNAVQDAIVGFASAAEDEDTLTGHLGAKLQSGIRTVPVRDVELGDGVWRWSIDYFKFLGRGPSATESILGADGVFQLVCDRGGRVDKKSLLFQAKLEGEGGRRLVEQCIKLSTWREAAFVLSFGPSHFRSIELDRVLADKGKVGSDVPATDLAEYLGGPFLNCDVGDVELSYDARERRLIWRSMNGEIVSTSFAVKHRVSLKVKAPPYRHKPGADRDISPDEIYKFRMQADPEDILGIASNPSPANAKKAQRALSVAYHPDAFAAYSPLLRQILGERMTEINVAAERKKKE